MSTLILRQRAGYLRGLAACAVFGAALLVTPGTVMTAAPGPGAPGLGERSRAHTAATGTSIVRTICSSVPDSAARRRRSRAWRR